MDAQFSSFSALPCSRSSEMIVLGSMLAKIDNVGAIICSLDKTDFFHTENQIIFQAMLSLTKQNKPGDIAHLAELLRRQNRLETVGGIAYLIALSQHAEDNPSIDEHIENLKKYSQLRELTHLARRMAHRAVALNKDPVEIARAAHEQISSIENRKMTHEKLRKRIIEKIAIRIYV